MHCRTVPAVCSVESWFHFASVFRFCFINPSDKWLFLFHECPYSVNKSEGTKMKWVRKATLRLVFLFKLLPLLLQCSSRGGRRTPLCSQSCTGNCRPRSVYLHHVEKILILLGVICSFFCPSRFFRVSWSIGGLSCTCCWVSPRTLADRPAEWENFYYFLYIFFLSCRD